MRKTILFLLIHAAVYHASFAQSRTADLEEIRRNTVAAGFVGYSAVYSLHYERVFLVHQVGGLTGFTSGLVGIGLSGSPPLSLDEVSFLSFPHHLTYNLGFDPFRVEFGAGGTLINGNKNRFFLLAGVRLHSLDGNRVQLRFFSRLPLSGQDEDIFDPVLGWSIGIVF